MRRRTTKRCATGKAKAVPCTAIREDIPPPLSKNLKSPYTARRSFGSDSRNWVGERRTIRLNARLKFVMDWNPHAKATSLTREFGLSKSVFDFSTRTLER